MMRHEGFFAHHLAEMRREEPDIECPVRLARSVLERIGVQLPQNEMDQFVQDLMPRTTITTELISIRKEVA